MVFQDPYTSLNPAKKVGWILEEPLRLNTTLTKEERLPLVQSILRETELPLDVIDRYVAELKLKSFGGSFDTLSEKQKAYMAGH